MTSAQLREADSRSTRAAVALRLPGLDLDAPAWQVRSHRDPAALVLADRHYSRRRPGSGQLGPPGRKLVFVTPCEQAVWLTHWPYAELALDGLDAWRCTIFRNEGVNGIRSSELVRAAMELTARLWADRPADGWITWIEPARSPRPIRATASSRPAGTWTAPGGTPGSSGSARP